MSTSRSTRCHVKAAEARMLGLLENSAVSRKNLWHSCSQRGRADKASFLPKHQACPRSEAGSVSKINRDIAHSPSQHLDTLIFCFDNMGKETWRHISLCPGPEQCPSCQEACRLALESGVPPRCSLVYSSMCALAHLCASV